MHLVMQHILSMFLHNIKYVLNQERDIIIHVILKKNKTRHKIKYFCLFENFQCFWIFFFFFCLKSKQPKTKSKHIHKQLKELNQGQVNNTHLNKSFLTHIARVFGFVGEKP